jgi:hypothetical protein
MAAQTIAANTWTWNHAVRQGNNTQKFAGIGAYLYVWTPSTGTLVGWINQGSSSGGAVLTSAAGTITVEMTTFSGSSVTCSQGDVLILEAWERITPSQNVSSSGNMYFDGGTTLAGTSGVTAVSDVATILSTPGTIAFSTLWTPTIPTETVTVSDALVKHKVKVKTIADTASGTVTDAAKKKALHKTPESIRSRVVIQA